MDIGIEVLLGTTLKQIELDHYEILFILDDGRSFKMTHYQDCCENVYVEDIIGDINSLLNSPIMMAEKSTNYDNPKKGFHEDSYTWTFYKLATVKGYVTIRWYGESNGYYSEEVEIEEIKRIKKGD